MTSEMPVQLNVRLLQEILDALDISQYQLCAMTNLPKGTISKALSGGIKNPDQVEIGKVARIASALDLPLGAIVAPQDERWHRLDAEDEEQLFRFLLLISKSGCLLTASDSADSHILPDDIAMELERQRLQAIPLSDAKRQQFLERHQHTIEFRKRARQEGSHLTQIIAPVTLWGACINGNEPQAETMKNRVREFHELTAACFLSDHRWQSVRDDITSLIGFDGWSKINVGGHLILAVWYFSQAFFTTDDRLVSGVRRILEVATEELGLPRFERRGAAFDEDRMTGCCTNAIKTIDGSLESRWRRRQR